MTSISELLSTRRLHHGVRKDRSTGRHGHVCHVKHPEPVLAKTDIDKVDNATRDEDAIAQVAKRSSNNKPNPNGSPSRLDRQLLIPSAQYDKDYERTEYEDRARPNADGKSHRADGVVRQRESKHVAKDVVRHTRSQCVLNSAFSGAIGDCHRESEWPDETKRLHERAFHTFKKVIPNQKGPLPEKFGSGPFSYYWR